VATLPDQNAVVAVEPSISDERKAELKRARREALRAASNKPWPIALPDPELTRKTLARISAREIGQDIQHDDSVIHSERRYRK
jgi:hypothetical protein